MQELILVQARRDHPREICGIVSVRNRARGYTPRVGITSSTFPFLAKVISTYINIATLKFSPILLLIATLKNSLERPVQYRSENQLKVLITCIGLLLFSLILFRENFFDHRSPITALRFSSADHDFGVYVTPSFLHTLLTYMAIFFNYLMFIVFPFIYIKDLSRKALTSPPYLTKVSFEIADGRDVPKRIVAKPSGTGCFA